MSLRQLRRRLPTFFRTAAAAAAAAADTPAAAADTPAAAADTPAAVVWPPPEKKLEARSAMMSAMTLMGSVLALASAGIMLWNSRSYFRSYVTLKGSPILVFKGFASLCAVGVSGLILIAESRSEYLVRRVWLATQFQRWKGRGALYTFQGVLVLTLVGGLSMALGHMLISAGLLYYYAGVIFEEVVEGMKTKKVETYHDPGEPLGNLLEGPLLSLESQSLPTRSKDNVAATAPELEGCPS